MMVLKPRVLFSTISLAVLLACGLQVTAGEITATTSSYTSPAGEKFHAVHVKANPNSSTITINKNHLIMVDTSASQLGEHRELSLAILDQLITNLPEGHKVSIWAVDVQSHPLTDGFVSVKHKSVKQGIAKLHNRFPAGSTNLHAALSKGMESFPKDQNGAIIYIGDGISSSNIILPKELRSLLSKLQAKHIPVHSCALGNKRDMQLLGILALNTGGITTTDNYKKSTQQSAPLLAQKLIRASIQMPVYTKTLSLTNANNATLENATILPNTALPLRFDRGTIYLVNGELAKNSQIHLSLQDNNSLNATIAVQSATQANLFLPSLWNRATQDQGLSVPLAGNEMIQIVRKSFGQNFDRMVASGNKAVTLRQFDKAIQIANRIEQIDPKNTQARTIKTVSNKMKLQNVSFINNVAFAPNDDSGFKQREEAPTAKESDPQQKYLIKRKVATERLQLQVERAVIAARRNASEEADASLELLDRTLGTVQTAFDIDKTVKASLERKIQHTILDINGRKEAYENASIAAQERQAELEARQRLIEERLLVDEQLGQLIREIGVYMKDGFGGDPDAFAKGETVARSAVNLKPDSGTATAALFNVEAAGQLNDAFRLRSVRADRFLATLTQVELSHVPFPDEPPLRYPPAAVWRELTESRKKWADVDLKKNSPAEVRIREALDTETQFDFEETTLQEIFDTISERHNITIYPKDAELEAEGVLLDDTTTLVLSGITLRVGLKLILEKHALTWIIEDGMLKITTQSDADTKLETRVYPVADLVIQLGGQGGGGQGGGFGGQQGGGGFGGQQGGGFGGGGGGFGGNNQFSVPAAPINSLLLPDLSKKKH